MPVVSYLPTEILDYIATHRPDDDSVYGIGQKELAKALGYHPCSMSRPLAELVRAGQLRVRRAPVRGGLRKQLVYALTDAGHTSLVRQGENVPVFGSSLPPAPNPFVGRRAELRELLHQASVGSQIVHLEGPSGIGKSALMARGLRRLKVGRVPFWFTVRGGSSARHFTTSLAHALASSGTRQLAYYAQLPREPDGREVADLVRRTLGDQSLLAVVDDLQAATPDFKAFLTELAAGLIRSDRNDLLICLSQEAPFISADQAPIRVLRIEGIDRAAAHELTDRRGGLGERFESVFKATRGSPLLLQLAVTAPEAADSGAALPAAVVGRLSDSEVVGLLDPALANEPTPLLYVREVGGLSSSAISELVERGLLQRASEGRLEILQVVRAALVARASPAQVRAAHLRLARFYGRSHRMEAVRERFLHLVSGESWRLAGELLTKQEPALVASGYSETLRDAVGQVAASSPNESTRVRALRAEALLLRLHSDYAEAIESLERAASASKKDPKLRAECLLMTVELHARLGETALAEAAVRRAEEIGPSTRRLQLYHQHCEGRIREAKGDLLGARESYSEVFYLARRWGQSDLALESLARWSRLASMTSGWEGTQPLIEPGIEEARESGRMDIAFTLMYTRARGLSQEGRPDLALAEMNKVRAEAESLGHLSQLVQSLNGLAAVATQLERWEESTNFARQAADLADRLGNRAVLGYTLAIQCASELRQMKLEESRTHGEKAIEVLSQLPPADSLPVAHSYLAETYSYLGDKPKALEHYLAAIRLAESMGMTWWIDRIKTEFAARFKEEVARIDGQRPAA